jgi:Family of unknown function (DUF6062)
LLERYRVLYDLTSLQLKDALAQDGCALCRLREYYGRRYLSWFLHEQVNDVATRLKLAQSWGFCAYHAWLLQQLEWERSHDGMATAMLWEWLMRRYGTILQHSLEESCLPKKRLWHKWRWWRPSRPAEPLLHAFAAEGSCPTCTSQQESEAYALRVLTQHLAEDASFQTLYKQAGGLCMPHFKAALASAEEVQAVRVLVEVQRETLGSLAVELSEYVRKHDYRFAHEPYGAEADAFIRGTALLVGKAPPSGACQGTLAPPAPEY